MEHNLHIPTDPIIKDSIQLFWQIEGVHKFRSETIIPIGIIELMFNFFDTSYYSVNLGNQDFQFPRCVITGYNTIPINLRLPKMQSTFGIIFYPSSIQPLFDLPAGELLDQCIDMTLIDPSIDTLWHQLAEQPSFINRVDIVCQWLKKRAPQLDSRGQAFNNYLSMTSNNLMTVSEMANWLNYSNRHLSRKLQQLTGMNSEQTLMYKKYIRSIFLMHQTEMSLTEIGYASDFADQAHFSKTFKSYSAITPSEYKKRKSQIMGHFFDDVR